MTDGHSITEPQFLSITPQFAVSDVVATSRYYVDVLGFVSRGFYGDPPVFAIVSVAQSNCFSIRIQAAWGGHAFVHWATLMLTFVSAELTRSQKSFGPAARESRKDPLTESTECVRLSLRIAMISELPLGKNC